MVSLPTFTTLPLPETGAASILVPRFDAAARTSAEACSDTVEQSTRILGDLPATDSTPPWLKVTSFRSSEVETIVKTMSQEARSDGLAAILAPDFASGSALARVRLKAVKSQPALARRSAIGKPMRPVPIQPILCRFRSAALSRLVLPGMPIRAGALAHLPAPGKPNRDFTAQAWAAMFSAVGASQNFERS